MKKLERNLGLGPVVAISISSMLGSGIFVLPGLAFAQTGSTVWLAYLLSAICVLPAAISKSELATAMPTSGGTYVYLERTFGPFAGTIAGLGLWLSLLLKSAFALVGFGAYLSVLADVPITQVSIGFTILITFLNIIGVGKVSGILTVVVSIAIISLLVLSTGGLSTLDFNLLSFKKSYGMDGLLSATGLVFVSYAGVTKVAAIAEEIKDPEKNLPRGILISLLVVSFLYCTVTFVLGGNFALSDLSGNVKTIYTLAAKVGGPLVASAIAVLGVVTMTSMANAGLLAASRFPFAMARDKLLPGTLGKLHRTFLTPVWSIIFSGLVIGLCLAFLNVAKIAKLASAFILIIYMCENIAVIVLRELRVQWYKPTYRAIMYPWLQVFGIVSTLALLFQMGNLVLFAVLAITIPGLFIYLFYSKNRTTRKGVLGIRGKRSDLVETEQAKPNFSHYIETVKFTKDANVVVSLFGKEKSPEVLVEMGVALSNKGDIEVAHVTEAPEQTDLSDFCDDPVELRSIRRRLGAMSVEKNIPITFDPIVSHDIAKTIYEISQRVHCRWLITEWSGETSGVLSFHSPISWLKDHLECNFAIFKDAGVRYIRKVLVVLNNDGNDKLVIDTADHLAQVYNAEELTIVSYISDKASTDEFNKASSYLRDVSSNTIIKTTAYPIKGIDEVETITATSVEHDLMLFGTVTHKFTDNIFGSKADKFIKRAACSVLAVQSTKSINSN